MESPSNTHITLVNDYNKLEFEPHEHQMQLKPMKIDFLKLNVENPMEWIYKVSIFLSSITQI